MKIRKLTILDINDQDVSEFQSGVGRATHFEVRRLRTWKDLQRDVGGRSPCRPDIVLADIDFGEDPGIQGLDERHFPDCAGAKPIGPMLALPYVSSRAIWTYVVYSAHFSQRAISGLMTSPWVLLPMGILLAKGQGRTFGSRVLEGLDDEPEYLTIEKYLKDKPWLAIGDNSSALEEALEVYTGSLAQAITSGQVRVCNSEEVWQYLNGLIDQFDRDGDGVIEVDPEFHLEIISDSFGVDRIQWLSLCADFVGWSASHVDRDAVENMLDFARTLFNGDDDNLLRETGTIDILFNKAIYAFKFQDEQFAHAYENQFHSGDMDIRRPPFHEVVNELYGAEPHDVRRELLRLGALFANAWSWAKNRFESCEWKDIADRLGYSPDANQYRRYFGSKGKGSTIYPRSVNVQKLDLFNNPEDGTESDRLEWGRSELSQQDKRRIRDFLELLHDDGEVIHFHLPDRIPYLE